MRDTSTDARSALDSHSKLVAIVGESEDDVINGIGLSSASGKIPLFIQVLGPKNKYVFPPYSLVTRSDESLAVVAYDHAYVFPLADVSVRFSSNSANVASQALPRVDSPALDRLVARYIRLRQNGQLADQYPKAMLQAKQETCPDCAMLETAPKHSEHLAQHFGSVSDPWFPQLTDVAVWTAADTAAAIARINGTHTVADRTRHHDDDCVMFTGGGGSGCNGGASSWSFPSWYSSGVGPCGYSSSFSSGGTNCAPRRKSPHHSPSARAKNLAACLALAASASMAEWQAYCSAKFTGGTARLCYAAGPESAQNRAGFCAARFGGGVV